MEDPNHSDPLLKPGAFIDPNPVSNGNGKAAKGSDKGQSQGQGQGQGQSSGQKTRASVEVTDMANRPDWLPSGWGFKEFLRTSSASAGTRDKYFIDPDSNRRFRSKKEVFRYLETGTTPAQKRKAGDSDAPNASGSNSAAPKSKKPEEKPKVSILDFKYDDVPEKVKWELTNVYDSTWSPKINGVEPVSELTQQEWAAVFTHLTLQNSGLMF